MDCQLLKELTSWPCRTIEASDGQGGLVVAPPVPFWDGSVIPMYVIPRGESVEITDDGALLQHLDASGFEVSGDRRRRKGLERALARWNVAFDSELRLLCKPSDLRYAMNRFMCALFSAAHWEAENVGKALDSSLLIEEAELYLRTINPNAAVVHDAELRGISGRRQIFPLKIDSTYYDAVGIHPASSAAVIKKLVDVRYVHENADRQITVIIEDRANADRAKQDVQIFTQLAHVTLFSDLERRALGVVRPH